MTHTNPLTRERKTPRVPRRGARGHFAKRGERDAHEVSRESDSGDDVAPAFIAQPRTLDELGETGEGSVQSATPGEEAEDETTERMIPEEAASPFMSSSAVRESAVAPCASAFAGGSAPAVSEDLSIGLPNR